MNEMNMKLLEKQQIIDQMNDHYAEMEQERDLFASNLEEIIMQKHVSIDDSQFIEKNKADAILQEQVKTLKSSFNNGNLARIIFVDGIHRIVCHWMTSIAFICMQYRTLFSDMNGVSIDKSKGFESSINMDENILLSKTKNGFCDETLTRTPSPSISIKKIFYDEKATTAPPQPKASTVSNEYSFSFEEERGCVHATDFYDQQGEAKEIIQKKPKTPTLCASNNDDMDELQCMVSTALYYLDAKESENHAENEFYGKDVCQDEYMNKINEKCGCKNGILESVKPLPPPATTKTIVFDEKVVQPTQQRTTNKDTFDYLKQHQTPQSQQLYGHDSHKRIRIKD